MSSLEFQLSSGGGVVFNATFFHEDWSGNVPECAKEHIPYVPVPFGCCV